MMIGSIFLLSLIMFVAAQYETHFPAETQVIYEKHGIGEGKFVCEKMDDKTSRIYGEAVCIRALHEVNPEFHRSDDIQSVHCREIWINGTDRVLAAACGFRNNHLVLIINGPAESFYYIGTRYFDTVNENGFSVKLFRCIKHEINLEGERASIILRETKNPREADHMFRMYPPLPLKRTATEVNENHVCFTIRGTNTLVGEELCKKARMKLRLWNGIPFGKRSFCAHHKLFGYFNLKTFPNTDPTKMLMIKCLFDEHPPKYFGLVNTTDPELYYVVRKDQGKLRLDSCIRIRNSQNSNFGFSDQEYQMHY